MRYVLTIVLCAITSLYAQENMLCQGHYWTEDEANLQMKTFAKSWNDQESWEVRAQMLREGMVKGMKLDQMPKIKGDFNPIIHSSREMDGYIVENIAIESFPGFYITGNLYRPAEKRDKYAAILCPHGHMQDKRLKEDVQTRSAVFARWERSYLPMIWLAMQNQNR